MRRWSFVVAVGMLAIAATTFAAPTKGREAWASGSLERFDTTTKSFVVKQGSHEMTFALAPSARMLEGRKALTVENLNSDVGRKVKIRYTANGDSKLADRIEVVELATAPVSKTAKN